MNSQPLRLLVSSLASLCALAAGTAWPQGESADRSEEAQHRETEELFREIERRLGRIDARLHEAADASTPLGGAGSLDTSRSDGEFVITAMDRLLAIQVHHSGPGG